MIEHWLARRLLLAVVAVSASGCAQVHLTQTPGTVLERTSVDTVSDIPDGIVAARVLPYALLSEEAYEPKLYQESPPPAMVLETFCQQPGVACFEDADAARILSGWRMIYARDVGGLGAQIWVTRGPVCNEAVIAFRGTERKRLINWVSNFHWITRPLPVVDQYERVEASIDGYIKTIEADKCYRPGFTRITAVGHSLGAGLAQHASYAQPRTNSVSISRIYGFDSTFVTGSRDPTLVNLHANSQDLIIERIYEHGEILAFPRFVMRQLNVPTVCDPRIVSARFDLISWHQGLVGQHNLKTFNGRLLQEAHDQPPDDDALSLEPCK